MATKLTEAPKEPTNGDVWIALQTLRNAGANVVATTDSDGVSTVKIEVVMEYGEA